MQAGISKVESWSPADLTSVRHGPTNVVPIPRSMLSVVLSVGGDMIRHFTDGFGLGPEDLALEVIHAVGPGGNFLAEDHTMLHFREQWQPALFDRQRFDAWKASGSKGLRARLREKTVDVMSHHPGTPLSEELSREVERILQL